MIWKSEKRDREDMEMAANVVEIVETLGDRPMLLSFLGLCAAANVLVWSVSIAFAERVYNAMSYVISDKIGMIVLGIPFSAGLYITYCLFRLKMPAIEDNKHLESEMMSSFAYQAESTKRWFVWLFSAAGGVVNVLLLILANMYFADQL